MIHVHVISMFFRIWFNGIFRITGSSINSKLDNIEIKSHEKS